MKIADQLARDVDRWGHAFCVKTDTPDLFMVERIPPQLILGGLFFYD